MFLHCLLTIRVVFVIGCSQFGQKVCFFSQSIKQSNQNVLEHCVHWRLRSTSNVSKHKPHSKSFWNVSNWSCLITLQNICFHLSIHFLSRFFSEGIMKGMPLNSLKYSVLFEALEQLLQTNSCLLIGLRITNLCQCTQKLNRSRSCISSFRACLDKFIFQL